ncbi:MAG: hypothetical protein IJ690_07620 [Clostridia bacterium]|nr:hypothetical protein [Clostridia bacterium]MBR1654774.1 hypothetical protein [Clostridia bacterium]
MFNLREFVKKGLLLAIGIQSDYWVILTSANWFQKGVLTEEDMLEIQTAIDEKNRRLEEIAHTISEEAEESIVDVEGE